MRNGFRSLVCDGDRLGFAARDAIRAAVHLTSDAPLGSMFQPNGQMQRSPWNAPGNPADRKEWEQTLPPAGPLPPPTSTQIPSPTQPVKPTGTYNGPLPSPTVKPPAAVASNTLPEPEAPSTLGAVVGNNTPMQPGGAPVARGPNGMPSGTAPPGGYEVPEASPTAPAATQGPAPKQAAAKPASTPTPPTETGETWNNLPVVSGGLPKSTEPSNAPPMTGPKVESWPAISGGGGGPAPPTPQQHISNYVQSKAPTTSSSSGGGGSSDPDPPLAPSQHVSNYVQSKSSSPSTSSPTTAQWRSPGGVPFDNTQAALAKQESGSSNSPTPSPSPSSSSPSPSSSGVGHTLPPSDPNSGTLANPG